MALGFAAEQLEAQVIAPEGTLFKGKVLAVSGTNDTGKFAILPQHANFISIVRDTIILHEEKRKAREIKINYGILYCKENRVDVYVGVTSEQAPPVSGAPASQKKPKKKR